jgi:hypothetical protein
MTIGTAYRALFIRDNISEHTCRCQDYLERTLTFPEARKEAIRNVHRPTPTTRRIRSTDGLYP